MTDPDPEPTALEALRKEWGAGWYFFRARSSSDAPGDNPTGDYIATLVDREWGVHRTLMHTTPAEMRQALVRQRAAADAGQPALASSPLVTL